MSLGCFLNGRHCSGKKDPSTSALKDQPNLIHPLHQILLTSSPFSSDLFQSLGGTTFSPATGNLPVASA